MSRSFNPNQMEWTFEEEEEYPAPSQDRLSTPTRVAGQVAARGLEKILGTPRALGEFGERLIPKKTIQKGAEKIGLGKGVENLFSFTEKYAPYKLFPTEEDVRGVTKKIGGGSFEPRSKGEERTGEVLGETLSMAFPFGGKVSLPRSFFSSLGANTAKYMTEELGGDPQTGEAAKLGAYALSAFIQPKAGKNFYENRYSQARKALPEDATVSSVPIENQLDALEKSLKKGGISSADKPALQQIENLREQMQGAQTPIDNLISAKRKINIDRGNLYKQLEGNKPGIKTASHNMDMVSKIVDNVLEDYGKTHPDWHSLYKEANQAFGAVSQSQKANQVIRSRLGKAALTHAGLAALLGHMGGLKGIAVAAAGGYPIYKIGQVAYQLMKSPALRKEFSKLYTNALKGNIQAIDSSLKKLNQAMEIQYPEQEWEFEEEEE